MPATVQVRRWGMAGMKAAPPTFGGSLLTGLQSAYTFEASGSMGADKSGNGNTLTLTGSVPQATGNAFPGTHAASWGDSGGFSPNGQLKAAVNAIPAASDFSMVIWVYPLTGTWFTTPYDMFVAGIVGAGSDQYGLFLRQSDLNYYFFVSGGGSGGTHVATGTAVSLAGVWHMLYCEFDHTAVKTGISMDAGALQQVATGGVPFALPTTFSIGSNGNGAGFTMDGRTDALLTYTRKLTAAEITRLFSAGAGLEPA